MSGIGSHQKTKGVTDNWLTPPDIVEQLGPFDLDPCANARQPWDTAQHHYTVWDDGLRQRWFGRVWLNPPYSNIKQWMAQMAEHNNGIALVFARTETAFWFDYIWTRATAICFLRGRLYFHYPDGSRAKANAGGPHALVAYGDENALAFDEDPGIAGKVVYP